MRRRVDLEEEEDEDDERAEERGSHDRLQEEHRKILSGLHREIERLQHKCSGRKFLPNVLMLALSWIL